MTPANKSSSAPISVRRIRILSYVLSFFMLASIIRLVDWQVLRYNEIVRLLPGDGGGSSQSRQTRGMILDSNGLPLAMDVWGYQVYASPRGMGGEAERRRAGGPRGGLLQ